MLRRSRHHRDTLATLGLATLTLIAACSSSGNGASAPSTAPGSSGNAGTTNAGNGGTANGMGGHGGTTTGGTAADGTSGAAQGGSSGKGGSAGIGTAGAAGSSEAGAGGKNGEAGAANGNAGTTDGEAGASNTMGREFAYVVGLNAGISEFELDASGAPQTIGDSGGIVKSERGFPYGIAVSPDQRFLYEVEDDTHLRTYALDDNGVMSQKPVAISTPGAQPDAIAVTGDGKFVYVGHADGIAIFAVDTATGTTSFTGGALSLGSAVQSLALSPNGKVLYATQPALGVRGFQVNPDTGDLTELTGSPFVKTVFPRGGLEITPNGKFMYASGMGLNAISIADNGALTLISTYLADVLSDGYAPNVAITHDGRFVYATQFLAQQPTGNGFGMFSGFSIQADGTLEILAGFPRPLDNAYSAAIDPSSHFLFVGMDDLDLFSVFAIAADGSLRELDQSPFMMQGFEPLFAFATRPPSRSSPLNPLK